MVDDDVVFSQDAAHVLGLALRGLEGRDWQFLYLGGSRSETNAIAYHHSAYDAILNAVPDNATDAALRFAPDFSLACFYVTSLKFLPELTGSLTATANIVVASQPVPTAVLR